jgi:hypothetical protein
MTQIISYSPKATYLPTYLPIMKKIVFDHHGRILCVVSSPLMPLQVLKHISYSERNDYLNSYSI